MKNVIGAVVLGIGIASVIAAVLGAIWFGVVFMLYGGIMQAVNNWGIDNSLVVWGILRAIFCNTAVLLGWAGVVLGMVVTGFGCALLDI